MKIDKGMFYEDINLKHGLIFRERQRLEQRNIELSKKLMELRESLSRLRPQICETCNEQVQTFLNQCNNSNGMSVFVLKPCSRSDCRGNKNYKAPSKM